MSKENRKSMKDSSEIDKNESVVNQNTENVSPSFEDSGLTEDKPLNDNEPIDSETPTETAVNSIVDSDVESPIDTAESVNKDGYFNDDEKFLKGDDLVIHDDIDLAIFQQSDNVLSWEVRKFLKENGRPRKRLSLRNDPPVFVIKTSDGKEVEFLITQELSKSLGQLFTNINKAYFGVDGTGPDEPLNLSKMKRMGTNFVNWVKINKIKAGLLFIFIAFMIITPIIS